MLYAVLLCLLLGHAAGLNDCSPAPDLCVAMLSYNRPQYLLATASSFVAYTAEVEPRLQYSMQVLDNGSGDTEVQQLKFGLQSLSINNLRLVHLHTTVGIARGFNLLFFDMCQHHQFILSLEDDWQAKATWPTSFPAVELAMGLLMSNSQVLEVWLRDASVPEELHHVYGWSSQSLKVQDTNITFNMTLQDCPLLMVPGGTSVWGVYTNGASLKHAARLRQVGKMQRENAALGYGDSGEEEFAERACRMGFAAALICHSTWQSCFSSTPGGQYDYKGLFEHIGKSRVPTSIDSRFNATLKTADVVGDTSDEVLQDVSHDVLIN